MVATPSVSGTTTPVSPTTPTRTSRAGSTSSARAVGPTSRTVASSATTGTPASGMTAAGIGIRSLSFATRASTVILDFALGRNHHDAQFYVLDSTFSKNMADKAIYPAVATDPRPFGDRYYYANDHRAGGDFAWFADNLPTA